MQHTTLVVYVGQRKSNKCKHNRQGKYGSTGNLGPKKGNKKFSER